MSKEFDDLRRRVYGSANPTEEQVQAVRKRAQAPVRKPTGRNPEIKKDALVNAITSSMKKNTAQAEDSLPGRALSMRNQLKQEAQRGVDEILSSRTGAVIRGAAKSTASGFANTAGTALDALRQADINASQENQRARQELENARRYREMVSAGRFADGRTMEDGDRERLLRLAELAEQRAGVYTESAAAQHEPLSQAVQRIQGGADRLSASSQEDIATAKEGLGRAGQFAVDVGVAGTQLLGDILAGSVTGGGALLPMAVRSFGSSAQTARQSGADLGQQLLYGTGSAALSVATEKISNVAAPFKAAFGAGVLDDALSRLPAKLSQSAAGRTVLSAIGEGGEEVVEDLVQPLLQRITYDSGALSQYQNPEFLSDTLYDGLIGAALGGVGGAADVAVNRIGPTAAQEGAGAAAGQKMGTNAAQVWGGSEGVQDAWRDTIVNEVRRNSGIGENESPASTSDGTSALSGDLETVVDAEDMAAIPGTVGTVTDGRASQVAPISTVQETGINVNHQEGQNRIRNTGETVRVVETLRDHIPKLSEAEPVSEVSSNSIPFVSGKTMAEKAKTLPGMEGKEQTSRLAESMPYNQYQEAATGLSRDDYAKLFRYMSQTEGQSIARAEELVYFIRDGHRTFLRDIDEAAFHELVQSLDDATAWNAPQMDAARMIQQELQGKSANMEIPAEEYTNFLQIMREHETSTGQGVQANAKWSRRNNQNGQTSELEAWENLQNSNLSDEGRQRLFQRIVQWDTQIEQAQTPQQLKDIILEVSRQRGVLNNSLTNRESRILTAVAGSSLDALSFDQLKQFAYAATSALSTDSTPVNWGQRIKTIQVLNMLSSPVTPARNLVGNTSFYGIDALAMRGASILDMALSHVTGTRSVASGGTSLNAAVQAMRMAIAEITMDVDMSGTESRYGTSSNRTFRAGGRLPERVLSMLERNQAYLLNATDEFYKGLASGTARRTQALVDSGKIRTDNPGYAQEQAQNLARYRTFQDNSALSIAIQDIHDVLNMIAGVGDSGRSVRGKTVHSFGLGDIVAPFTRVAGNLASRGLEYSPVNAVRGTVEIARNVAQAVQKKTVDPAAQARAVSDTARGLTGTAIAYGFMLLARAGLLRQADDENDPDVAALNSSEGITGTQLNLSAAERWIHDGSPVWQDGDTLIDLSSVQPLNLLMNLGTEMAKDYQNPIVTAFNATSEAFMDSTAELPVMQFLGNAATDIIRYGEDPREVLLQEGANTVAASVIPNILRTTARGLDDRPRNTYTGDTLLENVRDTVQNSIPVLREELPGSVNPMGDEKTYQIENDTARLLNTLLNPIGVNTYTQSAVSREMETLRGRTGDTSFYLSKSAPSKVSYTDSNGKQHSKSLTYEERQDYLRERGAVALTTFSSMMGSRAYRGASDEEKATLLNLCGDYASQRAKKAILGDDSVPAWVGHAENAQRELGVSPAEYLALYRQYGSEIMSGKAYEKTIQAVQAGLTVGQYASMKAGLDSDGNNSVSQTEAQAYLDRQDFTREQKADLWTIINKSWKRNPYA